MNEQTVNLPVQKRSRSVGFERVGQTIASLCWLTSVFAYGLESAGDWLQMGAASAWLAANIAAIVSGEEK